ncbi:MAG: hypothetical protein ACFCD0_21620 [Gemmataceae bacterium]
MIRKLLVLLLYVGGIAQSLAVVAIFFPYSWMERIHGWMLEEQISDTTIFSYLTRSLSMLYVAWGVVYLYIVTDVDHYLRFLLFLARLKIVLGFSLLILDVVAGMPLPWTLLEGPGIMIFSSVLVVLVRKRIAELKHSEG